MPYGVIFSGFDVPRHPLITVTIPSYLAPDFPRPLVYKNRRGGSLMQPPFFTSVYTPNAHILELTSRSSGEGDTFKQGGKFGCYIFFSHPEKLA